MSTALQPSYYRMPAEWEHHSGCWLGWPERSDNWHSLAIPAQKNFVAVATAISEFEQVTVCATSTQWKLARQMLPPQIRVIEMGQNDSWFRDQAPTFVVLKEEHASKHPELPSVVGVCWIFNSWGEYCYNDWSLDELINQKICDIERIPQFVPEMVLEGGSIHVDGKGTLLTTAECLLGKNDINKVRNPTHTKEQIESKLCQFLGIERIVWIPRGAYGDIDTTGHVDNMCCFLREGVVALHWCEEEEHKEQYERSTEAFNILIDAGFEVVKVPAPRNLIRTEKECEQLAPQADGTVARAPGDEMPGSYINFYMANGGIILPQFGDVERDAKAVEIMTNQFPNRKIVPIMSRDILCGGGNIHCITQQQPSGK
jgi:agmatine deiminase